MSIISTISEFARKNSLFTGKSLIVGCSGGSDSVALLRILREITDSDIYVVHVNHGLLPKGEPEQVIKVFKEQMKANLIYVDATDRFLDKLAGVDEPETKRKIIGKEFTGFTQKEIFAKC